MAHPGSADSPASNSIPYKNIHRLTPKQQAVHQQTINRHLSNRRLPAPEFIHNGNNSSNIAVPVSKNGANGSHHNSQKSSNDDDWDEKATPSQSHSIIKDLPIFPKHTAKKGGMKRPISAPSLSTLQQEKIESGLYLHPSQIPRSLSADFTVYQPPQELSLLMDLPMGAFMGIGGGRKSVKSLLVDALKKVEDDIIKLQSDEEEEDLRSDLRIDSSVNASQAIPTAPDAIPPSAIEKDYSIDMEDGIEFGVATKDKDRKSSIHRKSSIPRVDSRAHAQSMKHDIEQALKQGYTRNLMIAVTQALIGAFLYGWNVAILNVPADIVQNDATKMNDGEFAALASLFCAGGLIGALVGGPLQDRIGRKKALLMIDVVFLVSAAITYGYAIGALGAIDDKKWYIWFWLGRFLVGIACGAATAVVPTYLGEIAPPIIRGAIGTSNQLTICFGVVAVEFVGYKSIMGGSKTWPLLFLGNAVPLIQLLTAFSFPESPKWLVQKGRDSEARKALQRLRQTMDVRVDMMLMKGGLLHEQSAFHSPSHRSPRMRRKTSSKKMVQHKKPQNGHNAGMTDALLARHDLEVRQSDNINGDGQYKAAQIEPVASVPAINGSKGDAIITLSNRSNRSRVSSGSGKIGAFGMQWDIWKAVKWATIIAIALMFMQQFSGINAVFFYSSIILKKAGLTSDLAIWLGSVAISVANFLAVFIAVFSIDRAGRKLLLIISCVIMIFASIGVSVSIELESQSVVWQYASIAFLILFVIGFEVGLGAIPWLMMAEISPMQYRGIIVAIATASNWGANLLIAQFSGQLVETVRFYPFAVVCGLGIAFTLKYIPETNGKTAAEIQKELTNM